MNLSKDVRLLASKQGASLRDVEKLKNVFPLIPDDYVSLSLEKTEMEFEAKSGQYFRIWGPKGCIEMNEAYMFTKYIPGAIPFGDDGGGRTFLFMNGASGEGVYLVGNGNIDPEEAVHICGSLADLIENGAGIDSISY